MNVVVSGRNFVSEAEAFAKVVEATFIDVTYKVFPDGELYVKVNGVDRVKGSNVFVLNTLYPDQNGSIVESLLLLDALKRIGVNRVVLVLPYIAYSRQDKVFLEGEPVSIEVVLRMFREYVDVLLTVDLHNPDVLRIFNKPALNITVSDFLYESVVNEVEKPLIIAPDKGALNRARFVAEKYGVSVDYLVKKRDRVTGEITYETSELDVMGRDVVIVDDIISTGGTIAKSSEMLLSKGARKVYVVATHGLLINGALERLRRSGVRRVVLAKTLGVTYVDPLLSYVSIVDRLATVVRELLK